MMDLPPMQFGPFDMDDEDIPLPPEPDYPIFGMDPPPPDDPDDYEGPDPEPSDGLDDGGYDHRIVNHPEGFREP